MVKRERLDPVAVKEEKVDEEVFDVDNPKEIEVPEVCVSDDDEEEEEMPAKITLVPRELPKANVRLTKGPPQVKSVDFI